MSTHLPFLACWEFPKPFYFLSLNIPFERRILLLTFFPLAQKIQCICAVILLFRVKEVNPLFSLMLMLADLVLTISLGRV